MHRWSTREELTAQVVQLSKQGMGQRAIQRALGISRNSVRKSSTITPPLASASTHS